MADFDFADDTALLSEEIQPSQELFSREATSVGKLDFLMYAFKTKNMSGNHEGNFIIRTN